MAAQRINFATVNQAGRPVRTPQTLIDAMADFQLPDGWHARDLPELALEHQLAWSWAICLTLKGHLDQ